MTEAYADDPGQSSIAAPKLTLRSASLRGRSPANSPAAIAVVSRGTMAR
jgi:hypothetical protein